MNFSDYKQAIESILYGVGILSGSIGVKYLINAIKLFILHVMPMIKNTKQESKEKNDKCSFHDSSSLVYVPNILRKDADHVTVWLVSG